MMLISNHAKVKFLIIKDIKHAYSHLKRTQSTKKYKIFYESRDSGSVLFAAMSQSSRNACHFVIGRPVSVKISLQ